jgi:hypothetical protein
MDTEQDALSGSRGQDLFAKLAAPFSNDEVRSRRQNGRDMAYITARTVMNRLDEVVGPAGWWDEYQPIENAVICKLTLQLPSGQFLTKCDCGGFTTTADTSDYEKSGFSDAFKRAAVKFGIGRYLYGDGVPSFAREARSHDGESRPQPSRREPEPEPEAQRRQPQYSQDRPTGETSRGSAPRTGKALFAWVKERDEKLGVDLLRTLSDWGKGHGYPPRMVQWSDDEVQGGYAEAARLLETFGVNVNGSIRSSSNGSY